MHIAHVGNMLWLYVNHTRMDSKDNDSEQEPSIQAGSTTREQKNDVGTAQDMQPTGHASHAAADPKKASKATRASTRRKKAPAKYNPYAENLRRQLGQRTPKRRVGQM